jgi:hypothetical protein
VYFPKMNNLRRNVIGRGGKDRGGEMEGILFFVLHLALLLFTDSVNCTTPPVPETKHQIIVFTFVLYPLGSPVKSLPSLQVESGSSLRVQLMLACHPFLLCD